MHRWVVFTCALLAACLVAAEASEAPATTPATSLVSRSSAGTVGNRWSLQNTASADGRLVAFRSFSTNLVAHDTNGRWDVFVRDRVAGTTRRVSVSTGGRQGNGDAESPVISSDGRCVAFTSTASDLVLGDTNGARDVFVRDLATGVTSRVDVGAGGRQANGSAVAGWAVAVSDGCRLVAFASAASNLVSGDRNGHVDVFVRDRAAARTRRVGAGNGRSYLPAVSADGSTVAFTSAASNLAPGDTNRADDIFVYKVASGVLRRISVSPGGAPGNGASIRPMLSRDGRFVAFQSLASNLVAADTNRVQDVFVRDLVLHATQRASVPTGTRGQGRQRSFGPAISADGRYVGFTSASGNLVAGDTNGQLDGFVRDLAGHVTVRVTVSSGGAQAGVEAELTSLSADGRYATFRTAAGNMVSGDGNGHIDVFERGPLR